jgi:hypothetical protein
MASSCHVPRTVCTEALERSHSRWPFQWLGSALVGVALNLVALPSINITLHYNRLFFLVFGLPPAGALPFVFFFA